MHFNLVSVPAWIIISLLWLPFILFLWEKLWSQAFWRLVGLTDTHTQTHTRTHTRTHAHTPQWLPAAHQVMMTISVSQLQTGNLTLRQIISPPLLSCLVLSPCSGERPIGSGQNTLLLCISGMPLTLTPKSLTCGWASMRAHKRTCTEKELSKREEE